MKSAFELAEEGQARPLGVRSYRGQVEKVGVLWGIPRNWTQFPATQVMMGRSQGMGRDGCPRKE